MASCQVVPSYSAYSVDEDTVVGPACVVGAFDLCSMDDWGPVAVVYGD